MSDETQKPEEASSDTAAPAAEPKPESEAPKAEASAESAPAKPAEGTERPARDERSSEGAPAASGERSERSDRPERSDRGGERSDGDQPRRRGGGKRGRKYHKKRCWFCMNIGRRNRRHEGDFEIDYKNLDVLRRFITERGKILPRRMTGTCAYHQRVLQEAIKRARTVALLPFVNQG